MCDSRKLRSGAARGGVSVLIRGTPDRIVFGTRIIWIDSRLRAEVAEAQARVAAAEEAAAKARAGAEASLAEERDRAEAAVAEERARAERLEADLERERARAA